MSRGATSPAETWDAFFSDFYLRAFADDERDEEAAGPGARRRAAGGCPEGGDLLDAPCGFGRHSIPLARAGYRVDGVDRSPELIDEARRRAGGERWPKFTQADYRELPQPDASFDAALNLFTSIGYLGDEQDERALAEIGACCAPMAGWCSSSMHRDLLVRDFSEQDWRLVGEGRLLLEQRTFDPAAGIAQVTQTLVDGTASASRARTRCACTRRPSCSRCSRAPASPRRAATATSTAARSAPPPAWSSSRGVRVAAWSFGASGSGGRASARGWPTRRTGAPGRRAARAANRSRSRSSEKTEGAATCRKPTSNIGRRPRETRQGSGLPWDQTVTSSLRISATAFWAASGLRRNSGDV